jgi:hypothetical protein
MDLIYNKIIGPRIRNTKYYTDFMSIKIDELFDKYGKSV